MYIETLETLYIIIHKYLVQFIFDMILFCLTNKHY